MLRRVLALLTACALAVATATSASAIDGGTADYGGHPNVGLLVADLDGPDGPIPPFGFCTGSVISDSAFLTAAHCILPTLFPLPSDVSWAVTMESGSPEAPLFHGGYYPVDVPACCFLTVPASAIHYPTKIVVDPDYAPTSTETTGGAHDLAVLQFAPGTFAGITPIAIVHAGMLDNLGAAGRRRGPQVTVVGYGGEIRNDAVYFQGYRKTGRASLVDVAGNWLRLTQNTTSLPRSAALCLADSGSPQFLGGSNLVVSILHGGDVVLCNATAYAQRLDTPAEQSFLATFLGS